MTLTDRMTIATEVVVPAIRRGAGVSVETCGGELFDLRPTEDGREWLVNSRYIRARCARLDASASPADRKVVMTAYDATGGQQMAIVVAVDDIQGALALDAYYGDAAVVWSN